jgi:hypothetical protein
MIKKIPITNLWQGLPVGEVTFFDAEKITNILATGKYGFSGRYRMDEETGEMTLLELSIVPYEKISHLSLLDKENQNGNLKS